MLRLRCDILRTLEAGLVGLSLIQAARFLYAAIYARASSADLVGRVPADRALSDIPGVVELATVQTELVIVIGLLLLPLVALLLGRWSFTFTLTVLAVALGRSMALQLADLQVPATALVIGGGLLYLALIAIRRPAFLAPTVLLGVAGDQLLRAHFDTYDRTWQSDYSVRIAGAEQEMATLVSLAALLLIVVSLFTWYAERRLILAEAQAQHKQTREEKEQRPARPLRGHLNVWGGLALGAILYLELTLFGLPNAVAHWSGVGYAGLMPWLVGATLLPLVPEVREQARRFAGMFDGAWRGWLWMLLIGLLLVVGRRYEGLVAGIALVAAQFMVGLSLWWLVQVRPGRINVTPINMIIAVIGFAALAVGDYFSYDYAYVRDLADPYQNVGDVLRSFRGTGLGLTLIAALLLSTPMILTRRRIAWTGGKTLYTFGGLLLVVGGSFAGAMMAAGDVVRRPALPDCLRIATLNLHGGYSQFFDPNLDRAAQLIELNGADVVLLQEVDTGRLASFGVDQVLWLARRLQMEWAFYPQNEALQGIAVLSRLPITDVAGLKLPSAGNQAAAMRVILNPERLVADPQAAGLGGLYIYNAWIGFREALRDGQPVPEAEQDQNRQMETLLSWIAERHRPAWADRIVLGGTFNFGPESPWYVTLNNPVFEDPFAGVRLEDTMTVYLVDGMAARYDYLWTANLPLTQGDIPKPAVGALNDYARLMNTLIEHTSDHRLAIVAVGRRVGVQCPS